MKIVLIGSGGREHALAWKIKQSPLCTELYILPGNPGTGNIGTNIAMNVADKSAICKFCADNEIDLVFVGPEMPLANGLVDDLQIIGVKAFGPTKDAARIESSKHFSKGMMKRFNIPTAKFDVFTNPQTAKNYLATLPYPYVIKANGLTAGKGVFLPDTLDEAYRIIDDVMINLQFGDSGSEILIEERLRGPEISLMAFCDGKRAVAMLPAQDHKRLLDGQEGPNTGGMGAYAPVPFCTDEMISQLADEILMPAVKGMQSLGCPFVGVLYAGLMLTNTGPKVLEFNCRFGDPETQAVVPLLSSDLVQIALDCIHGDLDPDTVTWNDAYAATVVLASEGYPEKPITGMTITGWEKALDNCIVYHAGTCEKDGKLITSGGRVLNVSGIGRDLNQALEIAYQRISSIQFNGMQYRKDIGYEGLHRGIPKSAYQIAGVNIDAGIKAVQLIKKHVQATYNQNVLSDIGSFGGLFSLSSISNMSNPILVASTDGVGTKVKLASKYDRLEGIGKDIVNHCINDILVQGAKPLFFMNYFATENLIPEKLEQLLKGMSEACLEAGCVILGGETAEMPGVYVEGEFDVAGTIVGAVSKENILPKATIKPGDLLIGIASSGPHTNGYSLIRNVFAGLNLEQEIKEVPGLLIDVLLKPHRSYFPIIHPLLENSDWIKALAHITGGGFTENISRVLPEDCGVAIDRSAWVIPPLFKFIQKTGDISSEEMIRVFNMGIGMVIVSSPENVSLIQNGIPEETWVLGEVTANPGKVAYRD
jgi:phosphoribosylamine--glycine ligase/phosphoribosylaminoimidazole synthetase